jgi:hypothetical protein
MLEATNTLEEDEDSPIALATEALKLSQSNCQQVYSTVIGAFIRRIIDDSFIELRMNSLCTYDSND